MTDGPERARHGRTHDRDKPVETLASRALNKLALMKAEARVKIEDRLAETLRAAVLSNNPADRDNAITALRESGCPDEAIVDTYIPHVARLLGEDWCRDDIGFADTSIGASRLQSLLRDLTPDPRSVVGSATDMSGVAVVVLSDDNHTLGAMVLTHQLRRMGVSVRVLVGAPADEALKEIVSDRYDAVFISSSRTETLGKLKKFIESVKRQTRQEIPVVLGGRVIEFLNDVRAEAGADYATSSAEEAVRLCGLIARKHASSRSKT